MHGTFEKTVFLCGLRFETQDSDSRIQYWDCDLYLAGSVFDTGLMLDACLWCYGMRLCCQALRQMYKLVLGLDILGNPFGVIQGLATGVRVFFEEPYNGLIRGPEEFAEGLAGGFRSLFSSTVGRWLFTSVTLCQTDFMHFKTVFQIYSAHQFFYASAGC